MRKKNLNDLPNELLEKCFTDAGYDAVCRGEKVCMRYSLFLKPFIDEIDQLKQYYQSKCMPAVSKQDILSEISTPGSISQLNKKENFLIEAVSSLGHMRLLDALIKNGHLSLSALPLLAAILANQTKVINFFVCNNYDIDQYRKMSSILFNDNDRGRGLQPRGDAWHPLTYTIKYNQPASAKKLIEEGASIHDLNVGFDCTTGPFKFPVWMQIEEQTVSNEMLLTLNISREDLPIIRKNYENNIEQQVKNSYPGCRIM